MKYSFGEKVMVNGNLGLIVKVWEPLSERQSIYSQHYEVYDTVNESIGVFSENEIEACKE